MTVHRTWMIPGAPVTAYAWEIEQPVGMVLLTHALAEYAERYYHRYNGLIPALNKAGYNVYAYDLRGHGNSPGNPSALDAKEQISDHLAARRALKAQFPNLPFYLFVHSGTAPFVASSVLEDQSGVSGIIMTSPGLSAGQDMNPIARRLVPVASKLLPGVTAAPLYIDGLSRLPEEIAAYRSDPRMRLGDVSMKAGASILTTCQQLLPKYPNWQIPTLLIYSPDDPTIDMREIPKIFHSMGSADKTISPISGGYHELLNDLDRDKVLGIILKWLEDRKPKAGESNFHDERVDRLRRLQERRGSNS